MVVAFKQWMDSIHEQSKQPITTDGESDGSDSEECLTHHTNPIPELPGDSCPSDQQSDKETNGGISDPDAEVLDYEHCETMHNIAFVRLTVLYAHCSIKGLGLLQNSVEMNPPSWKKSLTS